MGKETVNSKDSLIRSSIMEAMQTVANVRSLLDSLNKHDVYGEYFQSKIPEQIDQLTVITVTLGEIYGYSLANETLNQTEEYDL